MMAIKDPRTKQHVNPFLGLYGNVMTVLNDTSPSSMYMLTCSIQPAEGESAGSEEKRPDGLMMLHEYAILGVKPNIIGKSGEVSNLVRVMNPHGEGEWGDHTGGIMPWCDEDESQWTDELRQQCDVSLIKEERLDGKFFMRWEDFRSIYTRMDLCQTFTGRDNYNRGTWRHAHVEVLP